MAQEECCLRSVVIFNRIGVDVFLEVGRGYESRPVTKRDSV